MGRPLKIAKAQAVITITNTTTSTNVVTTSANFTNLGIIAGMPFIVASNIGNLVAGTTYWILAVLNSGNNSTFTVSATPLNANPTSAQVALSTASGTVATTIAPVDNYFNNPVSGTGYPATNTATYGVVGGNTAIYGKQVLCNVAIGQDGTGTFYSSSSSANIGGVGTDFANTVAATTVIQYLDANGVYTTLGYVSSTDQPNVEISNATATGNFLTTVGDATDLYANLPVVLSGDIGGLTAGEVYFVKTIANATAFSVSLAPGGANVGLTNEDAVSYATQDVVTLAASASATLSNSSYIYATPEAGYIVRQKGKQKYLVSGTTSGLVGQCFTANVANTALLPNLMTITATYANSSTAKIQTLTDYHAGLFTSGSSPDALANIVSAGQPTGDLGYINTSPVYTTFNSAVTTVAPNALVAGITYVITTLGNTNWAAVGAPNGYAVGTVFTATGAGTGTGTATIGGAPYPIVTVGNA